MRKLLFLLAILCTWPSIGYAAGFVGVTGDTVATCGTPNTTPAVAQPGQVTIDQNGKACVNATVSASIAVAPVTTTVTAPTVTTGGTFQSVLSSNASRNGCLVQNPVAATETLFVYFGTNASASTAKSISLSPGSAVTCAVGGLAVATDNVSVTATTTGHALVVDAQ